MYKKGKNHNRKGKYIKELKYLHNPVHKFKKIKKFCEINYNYNKQKKGYTVRYKIGHQNQNGERKVRKMEIF